MLNIGGGELLIILLVALVFLGPARLPEVARQVGQTVSSLRSMARGFQTELEAAARPDPKIRRFEPPVEPPTDPEDIGRAAREVGTDLSDGADDDGESVSAGGPHDLRSDEEEE